MVAGINPPSTINTHGLLVRRSDLCSGWVGEPASVLGSPRHIMRVIRPSAPHPYGPVNRSPSARRAR